MIPSYAVPRSNNEVVLEFHTMPDFMGRRQFTLYWRTTYIPGRPEGEHPDPAKGEEFLVRGQVFFTKPESVTDRYAQRNISVRVLEIVQ